MLTLSRLQFQCKTRPVRRAFLFTKVRVCFRKQTIVCENTLSFSFSRYWFRFHKTALHPHPFFASLIKKGYPKTKKQKHGKVFRLKNCWLHPLSSVGALRSKLLY